METRSEITSLMIYLHLPLSLSLSLSPSFSLSLSSHRCVSVPQPHCACDDLRSLTKARETAQPLTSPLPALLSRSLPQTACDLIVAVIACSVLHMVTTLLLSYRRKRANHLKGMAKQRAVRLHKDTVRGVMIRERGKRLPSRAANFFGERLMDAVDGAIRPHQSSERQRVETAPRSRSDRCHGTRTIAVAKSLTRPMLPPGLPLRL